MSCRSPWCPGRDKERITPCLCREGIHRECLDVHRVRCDAEFDRCDVCMGLYPLKLAEASPARNEIGLHRLRRAILWCFGVICGACMTVNMDFVAPRTHNVTLFVAGLYLLVVILCAMHRLVTRVMVLVAASAPVYPLTGPGAEPLLG